MSAAETTTQEGTPAPSGHDRRRWLHPGDWRRADIRIYSSASDAPLTRRPTDAVLLALAVAGVVLLAIPAPGPTAIDQTITDFVKELPGLIDWFWDIAYDLLLLWALMVLALPLFSRGRRRLLLYELLAAALALGCALLAGRVAGTDWSASFHAIFASSGPAVYLAVRITLATAVVVSASPYLSRPLRHTGRWVLGLGAVAGVALGAEFPIGVLAGFAVGIGSAAVVHLLFGSPAGRLTLDQIALALDDLGVKAGDLGHAPFEPRGVALATATDPDGHALLVKVYGRDAQEGQLLSSVWSTLWRRDDSPRVSAGRLQQVEHEAYLTLLAERGGVPVLPVVAAGLATERDALIVTEATGRPFGSLTADEVDDRLLSSAWQIAERLEELGIAHGRVNGNTLVVRPDGSPALGGFVTAQVAAPDAEIAADRARLLVTTALGVGAERAVAAAASAIGREALADVLPYLQPAVLDRDTRRAVRQADWSMDDLRKESAGAAGVEAPKLVQLHRVTWSSILIVAVIGLVAYAMIASVSNIGLSTLIDELKDATPVWLLGALLMSPTIQFAMAFSTIGASARPVRYRAVLLLQYAIQFIQLAVPSSAARVALETRFFQRNGADVGAAVSVGLIDSFCGFLVQIALILIITLTGLANLDLSSRESSSSSSSGSSTGHPLLVLVAVLVVLSVVLVLAIPKYRRTLVEALPKARTWLRTQASSSLKALRVLRSPSKSTMIFLGNLVAQILQAIVLGLCLRAFGHHVPLAGLILVNTAASLFAGFMPVPGGMGVAEAAYTAGLVGLGIPSAAAMSTAVSFRLVTFYLPPIWGWWATARLRSDSYI